MTPDALPPNEGGGRVVVSGERRSRGHKPRHSAAGTSGSPRLEFARFVAEIVAMVLIALLVSHVVTTYVVQPYEIPSTSMESTLLIGDRVLVSKFAYARSSPRAGDVVVFPSPEIPAETLIKRVVAVGGQTVDIEDGKLIVDGKQAVEPYVNTEFPDHYQSDSTITVPAGFVYLMGDNRANSRDSRFFGAVPASKILGRALFLYWPIGRMRAL